MELQEREQGFSAVGISVAVIGPDTADSFERIFSQRRLGFIGLPDPSHQVLERLGQPVAWWTMGRMPAAFAVDSLGNVVWSHRGRFPWDLPKWDELIAAFDGHS